MRLRTRPIELSFICIQVDSTFVQHLVFIVCVLHVCWLLGWSWFGDFMFYSIIDSIIMTGFPFSSLNAIFVWCLHSQSHACSMFTTLCVFMSWKFSLGGGRKSFCSEFGLIRFCIFVFYFISGLKQIVTVLLAIKSILYYQKYANWLLSSLSYIQTLLTRQVITMNKTQL